MIYVNSQFMYKLISCLQSIKSKNKYFLTHVHVYLILMLQTNVFNRTSTSHKKKMVLCYSIQICLIWLPVLLAQPWFQWKIQMWKKIQNPGRRQIWLTHSTSRIFHVGKFLWKWGLEGVLNFHWVLFSLFQWLSMKT